MHPLVCPHCAQVDQVLSAQSVYATQSGTTYGSGVAVGGTLAGPVVARVESHGTVVSNLAARLAPPPQPRVRSAVGAGTVLALLGILVVSAIAATAGSASDGAGEMVGFAIAIIVLGAIPLVLRRVLRRERELKREFEAYAAVWPSMNYLWQRAMVCLRCHGVFFPPDTPAPGLGAGRLIPIGAFHDAITDLGTRLVLTPGEPPPAPPLPPAGS